MGLAFDRESSLQGRRAEGVRLKLSHQPEEKLDATTSKTLESFVLGGLRFCHHVDQVVFTLVDR